MSAQLRETELLRASVVEAAMTLGPKVTKMMFADSIYKHRREQGSSSGSSFDGFGIQFYDGYSATGSDSSSVIPEEPEENSSENFDSKTVLINDDFGSHFVLIPKIKELLQSSPPDDNPSEQLNIKTPKKGVKNFTFLSRKSVKKVESPQTKKQPYISTPRRLFPALDDPVAPTFIKPPPLSTRSDVSNSPRTTPTKLRKRINQVASDDWDFKDPDRPSFFFEQLPELLKDSNEERKSQDADSVDDRGYLSEGTGLSHKHTSFRRKKKNTNPYIDWGEKIVSGNRSKTNLRQDVPVPSVPKPVSLPVADRFIRKAPPSQTETETEKTPPEADVFSLDNKLLVLPPKPLHQLTATPISDSSFIMAPDLNVAKRLHLDRYTSEIGGLDGMIGADNLIKLQMMEKLLKKKEIRGLKEKPSPVPYPLSQPSPVPHPLSQSSPVSDESVPEIQVRPPSRAQTEPSSRDINPIRGRDAPFPNRQQSRSPGPIIRGREPAFPTKPIRRNVPQANVSPLRLRAPPERYKDMDFPRSVRSSYEKDLVREEEVAESLPVRGRRTDHGSTGSPSVYSQR